jgi:hypothetical protein
VHQQAALLSQGEGLSVGARDQLIRNADYLFEEGHVEKLLELFVGEAAPLGPALDVHDGLDVVDVGDCAQLLEACLLVNVLAVLLDSSVLLSGVVDCPLLVLELVHYLLQLREQLPLRSYVGRS